MNDRGIKTSQVDLIKNHLFQQSEDRIEEAQRAWSAMRGIIESDSDSVLMEYMRWFACLLNGSTREKDVYDQIAKESKGVVNATNLLSALESTAVTYAALFNPMSEKWNQYPLSVRDSISVLNDLEVKQMRPLLLAVATRFSPKELATSLQHFVSWIVRLNIAGGSKAGRLDTFYANLAYEVYKPDTTIKSYTQLYSSSRNAIPNDTQFKADFATFRVKVSKTARYYLRKLELRAGGSTKLGWEPTEDVLTVNLEHVMPRTPAASWSEQDIETHATRLGNLALMQADDNVNADGLPFDQKKPILSKSTFRLTEMIGEFQTWGTADIERRQKMLAEFAPGTWPVN